MGGTVRISARSARALLELEGVTVTTRDAAKGARLYARGPDLMRALTELRKALEPKRSVTFAKKRKAAKKRVNQKETRSIRELVMARAGKCEACGECIYTLELDHFFGRHGEQSERTCWFLCFYCHRDKTNNRPSAAEWLGRFISHCQRYGYDAERKRAQSRLHFVEARTTLSEVSP